MQSSYVLQANELLVTLTSQMTYQLDDKLGSYKQVLPPCDYTRPH